MVYSRAKPNVRALDSARKILRGHSNRPVESSLPKTDQLHNLTTTSLHIERFNAVGGRNSHDLKIGFLATYTESVDSTRVVRDAPIQIANDNEVLTVASKKPSDQQDPDGSW